MNLAQFLERGWVTFPHDPALQDWVDAARPVAERLEHDPVLQSQWLRCGDTWFAGVNVFPNDASGAAPADGVPALQGSVFEFIEETLAFSGFDWDPAQISVCYPGYPRPWHGESEAAFRFRRDRDAAHVDGLRRTDPGRRRSPAETHAFILGIPLNPAPRDAAPLVVWERSHELMRGAFRARLSGIPAEDWSAEDVTDTYTAARRKAFESCTRRTVAVQPGECYLVHRLALHGVAPWSAGADAPAKRAIAYFRPDPFPGASPGWWLERP
ncbi:MAG: hypothetical protein AAF479_15580 [Pseudomonadota bacterium]